MFADLLEGLKRAQRFRLEDQRGTEINFELPDFLKDNELNTRNKFRKTKAGSTATGEATDVTNANNREIPSQSPTKLVPPQPAPRLSVTRLQNTSTPNTQDSINTSSSSSNTSETANGNNVSSVSPCYENSDNTNLRGFGTPPPLPPKPKIKPNNWTSISASSNNVSAVVTTVVDASASTESSPRRKTQTNASNVNIPPRLIYLDQPNSSFV